VGEPKVTPPILKKDFSLKEHKICTYVCVHMATLAYWPVDSAVFMTLRFWLDVPVGSGHLKHKCEIYMRRMGANCCTFHHVRLICGVPEVL
jgi:hypothetical protein